MFDYDMVIEYVDGTYDPNFGSAEQWCWTHDATLDEEVHKRTIINNRLMRYFRINKRPVKQLVTPSIPREMTVGELQNTKRLERMNLLGLICNDIERYNNQKAINIPTTDDEETYKAMLYYAQYLREFCNQDDEWWNKDILSFNEWKINNTGSVQPVEPENKAQPDNEEEEL